MRSWLAAVACVGLASFARAETAEQQESVAKQTENPISSIEVLRLENATNFGIGPNDRTQNVLTLQPIVPLGIGADLVLIVIPRIPLVWQPDLTSSSGVEFGLGDIPLNAYLGPRSHGDLFWGIGPAFRIPTGTNSGLGRFDAGQFSMGVTGAAVVSPGHAVLGLFATNVWSVAGRENAPSVNTLILQPVLDYNLPGGWYFTSTPFIVSDWTAKAGQGWVVPVGGGFGKVTLLGPGLALGFDAQAFWNAVRPDFGPPWTLQVQMSLSLPK